MMRSGVHPDIYDRLVGDDFRANHLRKNVSRRRSSLLIFVCGGDTRYFPSRKLLAEYVAGRRNDRAERPSGSFVGLQSTFCVMAEDLYTSHYSDLFKSYNLLVQEALIADVSDSIILFAESVGSFCELGSFSVLPKTWPILAVIVDENHKDDQSYLIQGPIRLLELSRDEKREPEQGVLTDVFYINLPKGEKGEQNDEGARQACPNGPNPTDSPELRDYLEGLRERIHMSKDVLLPRKCFSTESSSQNDEDLDSRKDKASATHKQVVKRVVVDSKHPVLAGTFAMEVIDIISTFGPICYHDLIRLYCTLRMVDPDELRIKSPTINSLPDDKEDDASGCSDHPKKDDKRSKTIKPELVVALLTACGVIVNLFERGVDSDCQLDITDGFFTLTDDSQSMGHFMFRSGRKQKERKEFQRLQVRLKLHHQREYKRQRLKSLKEARRGNR